MPLIKKFIKYSNLPLHARIARVSLMMAFYDDQALLGLIDVPVAEKSPRNNILEEKITSYVSLWLQARRFLGFRDRCVFRSFLLCHMLRKNNIDAKVNFGLKRADPGGVSKEMLVDGHCWVSPGNEEMKTEYPFVIQRP